MFYGFRFDEEQLTETLKAHHRGLRFAVLDNEHDVAAWNTGELDVLLAQPASCAYGLNLQQGGHHLICTACRGAWSFTPRAKHGSTGRARPRVSSSTG